MALEASTICAKSTASVPLGSVLLWESGRQRATKQVLSSVLAVCKPKGKDEDLTPLRQNDSRTGPDDATVTVHILQPLGPSTLERDKLALPVCSEPHSSVKIKTSVGR